MTSYIFVITTVNSKSQAHTIAHMLVAKKLGACAQVVGPISSIYRWNGKIEKAQEWMVILKTKKSLFKKVEAAILKIHPYDTPEIVASPIAALGEKYGSWLHRELTQ